MDSDGHGPPPPILDLRGPTWVTAFLDHPLADHDVAVRFWQGVTGYALSVSRGADAEFASLMPPSGTGHLRVQRVGDGLARCHLDLHVTDPRAEAHRAVALGATEVTDQGHVVLTSPAGVAFCLVPDLPAAASSSVARPGSWPGGRSQVDQVCVDVPPSTFDVELRFWERLTRWSRTAVDSVEFERLDGDGMPLRLLLQRLDGEEPARLHLDLSADDRAAEAARHEALGARIEAVTDRGFTVLVDPVGRRYCVTDRVPRDR